MKYDPATETYESLGIIVTKEFLDSLSYEEQVQWWAYAYKRYRPDIWPPELITRMKSIYQKNQDP